MTVNDDTGCCCGPATALDTGLLWRVLDHTRTHLKEWGQRWWVRDTRHGTTYCFAGLTAVLHLGFAFRDGDLPSAQIHAIAKTALGLTRLQATYLFYWTSVRRTGLRAWLLPWGASRHPTFDELVGRVFEVTGFRYDPDLPPDREEPAEELIPVPVIAAQRRPEPDRVLVGVG